METDKRDQIENTTTFNRINTQEFMEDGDLLDTGTDLEHDTVHNTEEVEKNIYKNITTVISENKQDDGVLDRKN